MPPKAIEETLRTSLYKSSVICVTSLFVCASYSFHVGSLLNKSCDHAVCLSSIIVLRILPKSQLKKMLAQNDEKQPIIVHFLPRKVKNLAFSCDFDNKWFVG